MKRPFFAYKIGLAVIGLFTIGICIFVALQASSAKQDTAVVKRANEIAIKLNEHFYNADSIPASLQEAGIKDVPSAISYHKLSDDSYSFCIEYKAKSSGFDGANLIGSALSGYYGGYDSYDGDNASLYIPATHKKGKDCRTVKPFLYSGNSITNDIDTKGTDSPYATCGVNYNYSWSMLRVTNFTAAIGSNTKGSIVVDSVPASTYQVEPDVKVFNRDCAPLTTADIHADDWVSLYFDPYGSPIVMIVKET